MSVGFFSRILGLFNELHRALLACTPEVHQRGHCNGEDGDVVVIEIEFAELLEFSNFRRYSAEPESREECTR